FRTWHSLTFSELLNPFIQVYVSNTTVFYYFYGKKIPRSIRILFVFFPFKPSIIFFLVYHSLNCL
ncbi:MAG TPA: hypothetical protein PLU33_09980, partial [Treponemataceae bacterium]|nr:hypothetical protein [Treponemataceae bacterium]